MVLPGLLGMSWLGYRWAGPQEPGRVRTVLLILIGGLVGYNYLALGLPGGQELLASLGIFAGLIISALGGLIGGVGGYYWKVRLSG